MGNRRRSPWGSEPWTKKKRRQRAIGYEPSTIPFAFPITTPRNANSQTNFLTSQTYPTPHQKYLYSPIISLFCTHQQTSTQKKGRKKYPKVRSGFFVIMQGRNKWKTEIDQKKLAIVKFHESCFFFLELEKVGLWGGGKLRTLAKWQGWREERC